MGRRNPAALRGKTQGPTLAKRGWAPASYTFVKVETA
jgi:hypothetical protein